jgi:hypothetical protein
VLKEDLIAVVHLRGQISQRFSLQLAHIVTCLEGYEVVRVELGDIFLLTGGDTTLMLGKQIAQPQVFQFGDVCVLGFVQVLHVDGNDIDVINYLISIGGHNPQPRVERLALKHVLPGAHLVAVV